MRTVTLDANIYVSALAFHGKAESFIERLVRDPDIQIAVSDEIVAEVMRVLREKFGWTPEELRDGAALISASTIRVAPEERVSVVHNDPTDNKIVECALASGSDCIVSGDKHLLNLGEHAGIRMLRMSDFLREIGPARER